MSKLKTILALTAVLLLAACASQPAAVPTSAPTAPSGGVPTQAGYPPVATAPGGATAEATQPAYPATSGTQIIAAHPTEEGYPGPQGIPLPTRPSYPPPAGSLQLVKPDGSTAQLAVSDLKAMTQAQVSSGGQTQSGPRLLDVLQKAGITSFQSVTFSGSGKTLTLTKEQVTNDTILTLANDNTVGLADANLPAGQWLSTVVEVTVK